MYFIFAYIVSLVYLVDINEKKTSDFRIQNYSQVSSSQASKAVETLGLAEFKRLVSILKLQIIHMLSFLIK